MHRHLVAAVVTAVIVAGCATAPATTRPDPGTTLPASLPGGGSAGAARALPVHDRGPLTGYSRAAFGQAWADVDRNGCDTRNDVLRRDLRDVVLKPGTRGCVVLRGTLVDPYSGEVIGYVRGGADEVEVDHVVSLADAWQTGAASWTPAARTAFANDPLELLAVSTSQNRAKGDADLATWVPPRTAYRCAFAARQVAVKTRYRLWVTAAEQAAMIRILAACPPG